MAAGNSAPRLIEWPAHHRDRLETLIRKGVVVVRGGSGSGGVSACTEALKPRYRTPDDSPDKLPRTQDGRR